LTQTERRRSEAGVEEEAVVTNDQRRGLVASLGYAPNELERLRDPGSRLAYEALIRLLTAKQAELPEVGEPHPLLESESSPTVVIFGVQPGPVNRLDRLTAGFLFDVRRKPWIETGGTPFPWSSAMRCKSVSPKATPRSGPAQSVGKK
jgi:hypothetical protein